ncbi:hypothetical protein RR46_15264 [Papilio xuthus]|uniref:Uncharacterized protein n=1 Tax=Papilio xuthus TaxID=66420 RepID=A0A194PKX8_PAPXU|nr:hypothetical protein RR46_15264 [Papilio xuthus]
MPEREDVSQYQTFGPATRVEVGKRAAGTRRCSTTPIDIRNTRGTTDALLAFEILSIILKLLNKNVDTFVPYMYSQT